MAEAKILKLNRRQAVIGAVGTGTFHANLQSLLYSNSTGQIDQTFSEATASCPITDIVFTVDGNTTVTRGGNTVFVATAGQTDFSFAQRFGFVLDDKANANVQINFGSNTGSMFITLSKTAGFDDPDFQILPVNLKP